MPDENSLLSRIEKNVLVLDSEIFAAGELAANVAPVAGMREPSLTKSYAHSRKASCVFSTIKINLLTHSSKTKPNQVPDALANAVLNPQSLFSHTFPIKYKIPIRNQSSSSFY